jgi:hypothetical protein
MRAQHQTQMAVHVRKLNRGMNNQASKTTKAVNQQQQKCPPGAEFQNQEISIKLITSKLINK